MKAFTFVRPGTVEEAATAAAVKGSVIKAGGIDVLDRMKERIDKPERVVGLADIADKRLRTISTTESELHIGSLVTLAEIAASADVQTHCPALSDAAALAASPQIRARATLGGNIAQHTRCGYYRHRSFPCIKRGDDACPVLDDGAVQDNAAIFGNRPCASAHPSSLAPVLAACDATHWYANAVEPERSPIGKPIGGKWIYGRSFAGFYAPPSKGKASDRADDFLVTHLTVPVAPERMSSFAEIRQKSAFDWALVSCAVRVEIQTSEVKAARIWLGSVAPTPWRAEAAEKELVGRSLADENIEIVAEAAVAGATPLPGNAYKVDLVKVVVRRALERLRSAK